MPKTWSDTAGENSKAWEDNAADIRAAEHTRDEARAAWDNAQELVRHLHQVRDELKARMEQHLKRAGKPE